MLLKIIKHRIRKFDGSNQDSTITIGMPIKNRILCIDRVLDSLVKQTIQKQTQMILIDESTDGTMRAIGIQEQYKDEY
jgi:glycosyltransferase involved in cell wall biosynthesis